jgi:hypothetical protein
MTITAPLTHANGATHPQPPPAVPLLPRGPACPWPPGDMTPDTDTLTAVAASAVSRSLSRLRVPDGDTVITWAMAATVAVVAVDAAIVSYSHIYDLATGAAGSGTETGIQPRLLPLSIDGVIAEASLVLLYAARHKLKAPRLARCMLLLGIVATVAANVAHGLPSSLLSPVTHVVISALLSAWPAGAFIGSVEMAMGLVRAIRSVEAADSESDTSGDTDDDTDSDTDRDSDDDQDGGGDGNPKPPPRRGKDDPVTTVLRRHPDWDDDKIATRCGVSKRTVQRRRTALAKTEKAAS